MNRPLLRARVRRASAWALALSTAGLIGCGGNDPDERDPVENQRPDEWPDDGPDEGPDLNAPTAPPPAKAPARPRPPAKPRPKRGSSTVGAAQRQPGVARVEKAAPKKRRPSGGSATVKLRSRTFTSELRSFRKGDLIELELRRGGFSRGTFVRIGARELVLLEDQRKGEREVRFHPNQVKRVVLLHRPLRVVAPTESDLTAETPIESWLPQLAPGHVLGGRPQVLWNVRFLHNVPLVIKRISVLAALTFRERKGIRATFGARPVPQTLYPGDEVKYVGETLGYAATRRGTPPCIGMVNLYLVRRDYTVWPVYSADLLHRGDLKGESLTRFLDHEPTTFMLRHPGELRPLKIYRFQAKRVRQYLAHLEAIPGPDAVARMRSFKDPGLRDVESRLQKVYAAFSFSRPEELSQRLLFECTLPAVAGGAVRLLGYKRLIGKN